MKQKVDDFFQTARSWADDVYVEAIASRNRYRYAFLWSLLIVSLLVVCFMILLPLQRTQLVLMHHVDDGTTWVELVKNQKIKLTEAQIESDIVRYVINRESFSASIYDHQFSLINLLSNKAVAEEYQRSQSVNNPDSPINQFKQHGVRSVQVQNILFLKKDAGHPLAQVNFIVTDNDALSGRTHKQSFLALISWKYRGIAKDPESRWMNWDGFTVTHYSVQQRRI